MDTPLVIPFRKSIWRKTAGYQFGPLSPDEFDTISQIYDVFSAKLRIAFPICDDALVLAAEIDALPDDPAALDPSVLEVQIKHFLQRVTQLRGIAIKVAICSLAVRKGGLYAPADEKVTRGLVTLGVVTPDDATVLEHKSIGPFAHVYTTKVLPAWHAEIQRRTPEQADAYWASNA
ncbi:hypothetical protein [Burkholderia diffusa]|uniref:hypothetical protein n=1 Tax=Burkholderia diffusa TaxID=488732 RepID=UPI0015826884|nr:hypothetical protein [Burkholderia diffusa]